MSAVVAFLGGVIGGVTWALLFTMNVGIDLIWSYIPTQINFRFYPLVVCVIGGVVIGFWERRFGPYPRELSEIMTEVKSGEKVPYNNLHIIGIAALMPLIFGGCIGPEAGLTGVIVGLCFWFSDKFKFAFAEIDEIAKIGMAATVSIVFGSPLFGFFNQIEDENQQTVIPKNKKILMYFIGIIAGFGVFKLFSGIFGGTPGLGRFPGIENIGGIEWVSIIPLALIGGGIGILYFFFKRLVKVAIRPIKKYVVLNAVLAGVILGGVGIILPYTMFSGEHQMTQIIATWQNMGFILLFVTGIVKLLIGNICIEMGWRGGHIFPVIFSGVAIGYSLAIFMPIDPIFCVAVVTAALTSAILRKPLAVILLLLLCFPIDGIVPLSIGAVIGGAIPIPKFLNEI